MIVSKHERKGAKEEVQDAQKNGRQDAQAQALEHNNQSTNQGLAERKDLP
jgi:hypothetical protein